MLKEPVTLSDWISFLISRIEEIQADSRTIYSSYWQKFSLSITFIYALISIVLAAGVVVGIEPVVDILRDIFTDKGTLGSIAFLFIISILFPFIVGFFNNIKQREHLKDYEDILGKIYFDNLKDEEAILKSINEIEEKRSSDLTSYINEKFKKIWSDYWHPSKIVKVIHMITKKRKKVFVMNIDYNSASKMGYFGGIFVIFLTGLALIIVYIVRGYLTMTDFQILSIPLSLGIALFSIGIAFHSCKIANDSDKKMQSLSNYHLLEIKGIIEDIRLNLQKHITKLVHMSKIGREYQIEYNEYYTDYSYSMWKMFSYLKQIKTILKYSESNYQNQVIDYIHKYFDIVKEGRDNTKITLENKHKKYIRNSYELLTEFPAFIKYKEKDKLIKVVDDLTT